MEKEARMVIKDRDMTAELPSGSGEVKVGGSRNTSPVDLLHASVMGCSMGVLRAVLRNREVSYEDLTIDSTMTMNEKSPNVIESMDVRFAITNPSADADTLQRSLEQTVRACTVVQSIKDSIDVHESLKILRTK